MAESQRSCMKPIVQLLTDGFSDRFWRTVQKSDGCWAWNGGKNGRGYGSVSVVGRKFLAHRVAFVIESGVEIPDGLFVCHHCDNPICVRPDHLFLGTAADNNRDMTEKGRRIINPNRNLNLKPTKGSRNRHAKLDEKTVLEIRGRFAAGEDRYKLSAEYGVRHFQIYRIVARKQWKHI